jgi:hypothetical protein
MRAKDDPKAHCMPRGALRIHTDDMVDSELMDDYCLENEKDAIHLAGK